LLGSRLTRGATSHPELPEGIGTVSAILGANSSDPNETASADLEHGHRREALE